jgi:hypothetical protein
MTRQEWPEVLQKLAAEKIELSTRKNNNYAGDENALANFDLVEIITKGRITREQGIFVRMVDKVARLGNLLFDVQDEVGESTRDTVMDLAVYSDILTACLDEKAAAMEVIEASVAALPEPSALDKIRALAAQIMAAKATAAE